MSEEEVNTPLALLDVYTFCLSRFESARMMSPTLESTDSVSGIPSTVSGWDPPSYTAANTADTVSSCVYEAKLRFFLFQGSLFVDSIGVQPVVDEVSAVPAATLRRALTVPPPCRTLQRMT